MKRGAWKPGGMPVDVEHVFVGLDDQERAGDEMARVRAAGRIPMLTVEPRYAFPDAYDLKAWRRALAHDEPVYVRYMHEMNGAWYPWGGQPDRFRREWARWTAAMPPNARNVFCPNVGYPGSKPIADFWPGPESVDVFGFDGYARNGESMAHVFGAEFEDLDRLGGTRKPLWICETGTPRGRGQAKWWRDGMAWAERQGIAAVVAFSEDKSHLGGDERDWSLSKAAQRAFLGG